MIKSILLIDDESVQDYFDTLEEEMGNQQNVDFILKTFHFNPVDRRFEKDDRNIDHEKSRKALIEEHLSNKIDIVGCDFNLDSDKKDLTFEIVKTVREYNKNCQLFIYSGAMNQALLEMFSEAGKKPGEKLLQTALSSNITEFVPNRKILPDKLYKLLTNPTLSLVIENFLQVNGYLTIKNSFTDMNGRQLFEIAAEIRKGSLIGNKYLAQIVEHGLSHMVDLNNYE